MGRFSLTSSPELFEDDHDNQLTPFTARTDDNNDTLVHHEQQEPYVYTNTPSIYIYYDSYKPQRRISIWWLALGALMVAHLIARFGPPAPPLNSTNDDWHDFLQHHGTRLYQSITALTSVIPHVWHACLRNIRHEGIHIWDEWTRLPPCPLVGMNTTTTGDYTMVGQARAISVVVDALVAWNQQAPLVLLFSGTVGSGKAELARQLSQQLIVSSSTNKCIDGVLQVDARQQQDDDSILHTIQMHASRYGRHGALVIVRHLEDMSTRHLSQLFQVLQPYHKLIFVGITGIGTRAIHHHLKLYGNIQQIPKMQLEMDLRDQVDDHFGMNVEQSIHSIVPFVPIGQVELEEILQRMIGETSQLQEGIRWKSLVMTKELTQALVGPSNVEYIEWKDKTTGETVLVFSATGAHVLEEGSHIMNKITLQIKQCLVDVAPDRIAKLDYDESIGQGVVSWCVGSTSCFEACRFSI